MPFTFQEPFPAQDPNCVAKFHRSFEHTDWIDGESIVQAETDDGFNVRFHKIMQDLDALAADARQGLECTAAVRASLFKVIGEAQAELARLGAPAAVLTFTPTLVALSSDAWEHFVGGAQSPPNADADGMMAVTLPAGATLKQFRAVGTKPNGNLAVTLLRHALAAGSNPEELVAINPGASPNGFDLPKTVPSDKALVKNDTYRYYVRAQLDGATDAATLTCFQITTI